MKIEIVSAEQRRANARAVSDRSKWRVRYRSLTNEIRFLNARISKGSDTIRNRVTLDALQLQANIMMWERDMIKIELKETAYRYAPKQLVNSPPGWYELENVR